MIHARWRVITIVLVLMLSLMSINALTEESDEPVLGVHIGNLAPDFDLPLLVGPDDEGVTVNLYEQIEEYDVIILYFFFAAT